MKLLLATIIVFGVPAQADDIVLDWNSPENTETCTNAGPYTNPAGTRIWQLVGDVDHTINSLTLLGYEPGEYIFVATAYDTEDVGSRISGHAAKTVELFTTITDKAYTVVKSGGGFTAFVIGTIPVGTECDVNNTFKGSFDFEPFTGYAVPVELASITGNVEPSAVFAECG